MLPTGFLVSRRTQDLTRVASNFEYGACTLCGGPFNVLPLSSANPFSVVLLPRPLGRFGLLPLRSPLLRESFLFSFPPGTKMFQFPGLLSHGLWIQPWMTAHCRCRVPPFGYPRIVALLPLPEAFRRLMRPSSAVSG